MLTLAHLLTLGAILFTLSVIGIFMNRKNLIVLLMAIELMLLAVNMNFIAFSHFLGDTAGQIFVFFILTVAAAESAIGTTRYDIDLTKCIFCGFCEESCPVDSIVETHIHEYHGEKRGDLYFTKEMLLAVGDRYEQEIAAAREADAKYR